MASSSRTQHVEHAEDGVLVCMYMCVCLRVSMCACISVCLCTACVYVCSPPLQVHSAVCLVVSN